MREVRVPIQKQARSGSNEDGQDYEGGGRYVLLRTPVQSHKDDDDNKRMRRFGVEPEEIYAAQARRKRDKAPEAEDQSVAADMQESDTFRTARISQGQRTKKRGGERVIPLQPRVPDAAIDIGGRDKEFTLESPSHSSHTGASRAPLENLSKTCIDCGSLFARLSGLKKHQRHGEI